MNIKLNRSIIMDRCGVVSFKRGEALYQKDHVRLNEVSEDHVKATISSGGDFHVHLNIKRDGSFEVNCSCPVLASFSKDCQHIAAVLHKILDYKHRQSIHEDTGQILETKLTQQMVQLFEDKTVPSSGHQLHFEKRIVLQVNFLCKLVQLEDQNFMFGIGINIDGKHVLKMRDFLHQVKEATRYKLSDLFTYDPELHCFQKETDAVISLLIQVAQDASIQFDEGRENDILLIPPATWGRLEPLLAKAPNVVLEYDNHRYHGLQIIDEALPLDFYFSQSQNEDYRLEIKGLHSMILLPAYRTAVLDGKLMILKSEENQRIHELKQMLDESDTDIIPIPVGQMKFFMEKVIPGLRKMGSVHLSGDVLKQFENSPLIAKLYLDRVKNRLLAGLEFHYDTIVINPLEQMEIRTGPMIVRNIEKETEILQLMDDSSFAKTDSGYYFQNEELEYEFLYHMLPKLQTLVQIYATTAVRNRIAKSPVRPIIRVKHKKERTNWLEFSFKMEGFPEEEIREVLSALEEKRRYFRLKNGSLMSLETREMEEIRRFLLAAPLQDDDLEKGLHVSLTKGLRLLDIVDNPDIFSLEESFKQLLEKIKTPDSEKFLVPNELDPVLKGYQKHGYRWMRTLADYGFGGILADDMGLGKTLQSIAYMVSVMEEVRNEKLPILVVCPSSVTYNWLHELIKFSPAVQAVVMDGNVSLRKKLQQDLASVDVLITSYPLLRSDQKWYEKQRFHTVFFDEAQAFKNPITQTARTVKKVQANHHFALTGTPVENSLEELWSIFHIVFPELFGSLKDYSNLTRAKIARRIRPFMLRRVKEDVLEELPGKVEHIESVELLPEQKTLYTAYLAKLRHKTFKHLDQDTIRKNRIKILAGLTRLRQICCHPALFVDGYEGNSAKFIRLLSILEEARLSGRRVIVFSQFTKMLDIIGRELTHKGLAFMYMDGKTPAEQRLSLCNRFNGGEHDVFLISLKAGGTGLNLTGADTVIFYDLWWNPALEEQAADRAHRLGQQNTVHVIKLFTRGTIEEKMNELQERKRHLINEIIDPTDHEALKLTEEDIQEMLSL